MRPIIGLRASVAAMAVWLAATPAMADCLADLQRVAAAQIADLDTQGQTPSRFTTIRTDLRTGKVVADLATEHAPPDRARTTLHANGTVEITVTTADRLWLGHGGALQEVPATVARERIEQAQQHVAAFRARLAAADWSQLAQALGCRPDATLDGHPAVLFAFTNAESGLATKLYADPTSFQPLRTETTGNGFAVVQTIERDPAIHIDLPITPE